MLSNFDIFSDDQSLIGTAGTDPSTKYVDVGKFAGRGEVIDLLIRITTAMVGGTSLCVMVSECATVDGSYTEVARTPVVVTADLVVGYTFKLQYLPKADKRYIKLNYITLGTYSAGEVFAAVEAGEDDSYEDGLYFSPRNPTGAR